MTAMNLLETASHIRETYFRYLQTTFPFQDQRLAQAYKGSLRESSDQLIKGPILEASPPYLPGDSLTDLIHQGVLHPEMRQLHSDALPFDRSLYRHQEKAIRHTVERGRNAVVATGTGSGKTEAFLVPIFNHLIRERES